jgi:hypothetical protein
VLLIQTRNSHHEQAFRTIAGNDNFPIFAALEDSFETIESQVALLFLVSMTTKTRRLEERSDVPGVSHALLPCGRRKFDAILFAERLHFLTWVLCVSSREEG